MAKDDKGKDRAEQMKDAAADVALAAGLGGDAATAASALDFLEQLEKGPQHAPRETGGEGG
jgi:succinyl-CoA synthetase alpha subunit